ncbi:MAG: SprB repeat-containing protein [Saprospiraceae bacterium]
MNPFVIGYQVVEPTCNGDTDGSASITLSVGNAGYIFTWNDPSNTVGTSISNVPAGWYQVTIDNQNGCIVTDSVLIDEPDVLLANAEAIGSVVIW